MIQSVEVRSHLHGPSHQFCDPIDAVLSPAFGLTLRSARVDDMGTAYQCLLPVTPLEAWYVRMKHAPQVIDPAFLHQSRRSDNLIRRNFIECAID